MKSWQVSNLQMHMHIKCNLFAHNIPYKILHIYSKQHNPIYLIIITQEVYMKWNGYDSYRRQEKLLPYHFISSACYFLHYVNKSARLSNLYWESAGLCRRSMHYYQHTYFKYTYNMEQQARYLHEGRSRIKCKKSINENK